MRRLLLSICVVLLTASPSTAWKLKCAPQPGYGIEYYQITGFPVSVDASRIPLDPTETYGFVFDLDVLPLGTYIARARCCKTDTLQGEICSAYSNPFSFTVYKVQGRKMPRKVNEVNIPGKVQGK